MTDYSIEDPFPCHMTFSNTGIDAFATLMHCAYAHLAQLGSAGDAIHHKNAMNYINHHVKPGTVMRLEADASSAVYLIQVHGHINTTRMKVRIGQRINTAVQIFQPGSNTWVTVDLRTIKVQP